MNRKWNALAVNMLRSRRKLVGEEFPRMRLVGNVQLFPERTSLRVVNFPDKNDPGTTGLVCSSETLANDRSNPAGGGNIFCLFSPGNVSSAGTVTVVLPTSDVRRCRRSSGPE